MKKKLKKENEKSNNRWAENERKGYFHFIKLFVITLGRTFLICIHGFLCLKLFWKSALQLMDIFNVSKWATTTKYFQKSLLSTEEGQRQKRLLMISFSFAQVYFKVLSAKQPNICYFQKKSVPSFRWSKPG